MVRATMAPREDFMQTMGLLPGKLVYANAAGIPMVFLNDFQASEDLLNLRGDKYDDKPKMVMLNELCNGKYIVSTHVVQLSTPQLVTVAIHWHG